MYRHNDIQLNTSAGDRFIDSTICYHFLSLPYQPHFEADAGGSSPTFEQEVDLKASQGSLQYNRAMPD
jgi:hypothetical protein